MNINERFGIGILMETDAQRDYEPKVVLTRVRKIIRGVYLMVYLFLQKVTEILICNNLL